MNDILNNPIYKRYFDRISENAFVSKDHGVCLPFKFVENTLRQIVMEYQEKKKTQQYSYWDEPIDNDL